MGAVTAFARAVTAANAGIGRFMSYFVLVLFVLLLGDVVMRYVQQSPIAWSAQLSKLLFGVYAIIGGGYVLARREHVNVDLYYGTLSRRRQAAVDIATSFLFFLFLGVLLHESWSMAADSIARLEVSYETTWRPPIWPSKSLIVVAAALLLLQGIVKLIADAMILLGIPVDERAYGPLRDGEPEQGEGGGRGDV